VPAQPRQRRAHQLVGGARVGELELARELGEVAALEPAAEGRELVGGQLRLGELDELAGRLAGGRVRLLAAMNLGYLSSMRGRRMYKLVGVEPGALLTIDGKALGIGARARVQLALDTIAWARELRHTPLAIGAAALFWAAVALYVWRGLKVWWAPLPVLLLAVVHLWRLTRRGVEIGTTHGSADVFHGQPRVGLTRHASGSPNLYEPGAAPAPRAVTPPPTPDRCDTAALACPGVDPSGDLARVAEARALREAGRPREALCALNIVTDDGAVSASAAREEALAWEAHGCRARAQQTLCDDVNKNPRDGRTGWRDTCAACRQLEAACCAPCGEALPPVAQTPEQLLALQREALAEHDAAAFAATFDPALLRLGASAGDVDGDREAGLAELTRDLERMKKRSSTSHLLASWSHVSTPADDERVAWLIVDIEWTWVTDGKEKKMRWVLSQVAERQDDGWRVVAAHWSRPMADKTALARAKAGKQPPAEAWPPPTGGDGAAAAEEARVAFRDALGEAPLAPLFGAREDAVAVGSAEDERWIGRAATKAWTGIEARLAVEGEPAAWPIAGGAGVYVAANLLLFAKGETPVVPPAVEEGDAPVDAGPPGATPRRFRLTALLVRDEGGRWQIVLLHASSAR
jgi:hypothetical protein